MTDVGAAREPDTGLGRISRWLLGAATVASFLLVFQNFGADILPDRKVRIDPARIRPYSAEKTFAYVFAFDGSEADLWPSDRSRVRFFEETRQYTLRLHTPDEVILVGGDRFSHEPGRIVFSTIENTDPRANGRSYYFYTPVFYTAGIGDASVVVFLLCVTAWAALGRRRARGVIGARSGWAWPIHLGMATAVFFLGLYCNTGSMAPYAITSFPYVVSHTGYAYNGDHKHFRVLFDFVDGRERSVWDHAILLRRILFPVIGWPFMKLLGFDIGGAVASLVYNVAAFAAALALARRLIGERAAIFAAWVLALYPGAAYWGGLPYTYALIFPSSLLLMLAIVKLDADKRWRSVALVSAAMGIAYLGYDLAVTFIPASVLLLAWRKRFAAAVLSAATQVIPSVAWLWLLTHVFHQPLQNGNSGIYLNVIAPFLRAVDPSWWWRQALEAPGNGFDIFFGSNFIFIPGLFLAVLALNTLTSRVKMSAAEGSLLVSGFLFFAVLNLAPSDTGGWEMKGTWIARLYQPVFPALVLFMARWWQDLPAIGGKMRALIAATLAAATLGDALIVFGPILGNPLGLSGYAFYRFYDHTDAHFVYEQNLKQLGRRPLGFPMRMKPPPTAQEMEVQRLSQLAASQNELLEVRKAEQGAAAALWQVRHTLRDVGAAAMRARAAVYSQDLQRRQVSGVITEAEARRLAKDSADFALPGLTDVLRDSSLDHDFTPSPIEPAPALAADVQRETVREMAGLTELQKRIAAAQDQLTLALKEEAQAVSDLNQKQ